jgi:hypothetical protein
MQNSWDSIICDSPSSSHLWTQRRQFCLCSKVNGDGVTNSRNEVHSGKNVCHSPSCLRAATTVARLDYICLRARRAYRMCNPGARKCQRYISGGWADGRTRPRQQTAVYPRHVRQFPKYIERQAAPSSCIYTARSPTMQAARPGNGARAGQVSVERVSHTICILRPKNIALEWSSPGKEGERKERREEAIFLGFFSFFSLLSGQPWVCTIGL